VHRAYGMVKPRVGSTRENGTEQPSLRNPAEALEIGMLYDVKQNFVGDFYKSVYGVVYDFQFIAHGMKNKGKDTHFSGKALHISWFYFSMGGFLSF